MTRIFMIYADEKPERSGTRRSQMAKICANHKNPRHLRAKKQIAAFDRAEYTNKELPKIPSQKISQQLVSQTSTTKRSAERS
ncbi:MAG: hypothetical protein LBG47_06775 [Prevotellaceae bacterium]|nr:hypothetical protein [Prevotellaceae bacterium]